MKEDFVVTTRVFCVCFFAALVLGVSAAAEIDRSGVMADLPTFKDYTAKRASSFDPSGGNADGRQDKPIQPGETRVLAEIEGAGAITHIWTTIASSDPLHLRNLVLRMYWDGEERPSVESPVGDFFGLGHAQYYHYESFPIQMGTNNGMNCYWRMPFGDGAKVTVTNEGPVAVGAYYYYIDYQVYESLPDDVGRFHAQYKQAFPCPEGENYVFLEAEGRGHYVGCNLSIHNRANGWWGEGDDMIYVDGEDFPSLHGTGSEDYFCGAWCYGEPFSTLYFGCPLRGPHEVNGLWNVYRYHIVDPIPFEESIRVTIEHGHANDRSDNWSSVAYWYQREPHAPFPPLPRAEERMHEEVVPYVEEGAIELEDTAGDWVGGAHRPQAMAYNTAEWSDMEQLWFLADEPTTYATVWEIPAEGAGENEVELWYTVANDYGDCELWLNGEEVTAWEGFNPVVDRRKTTFTAELEPGTNEVELRIVGKQAESSNYLAGLDCVRLTPAT
jgi:hypothetical protein